MAQEKFTNNAVTTLDGDHDSSDTSLTVVSGTGFPDFQFRVKIDDEIILVDTRSGTSLFCQRGMEGTAPASHTSGATVSHILTAGALEKLRREIGADVSTDDDTSAAIGYMTHLTNGNTISLGVQNEDATDTTIMFGQGAIGRIAGTITEANFHGLEIGDAQRFRISGAIATTDTATYIQWAPSVQTLVAGDSNELWFIKYRIVAASALNSACWEGEIVCQWTGGFDFLYGSASGSEIFIGTPYGGNIWTSDAGLTMAIISLSSGFAFLVDNILDEPTNWHAFVDVVQVMRPMAGSSGGS